MQGPRLPERWWGKSLPLKGLQGRMRQSQAGSLSFWDLETCGKAGTSGSVGERLCGNASAGKRLSLSIHLETLMETGKEKRLLFHNLN